MMKRITEEDTSFCRKTDATKKKHNFFGLLCVTDPKSKLVKLFSHNSLNTLVYFSCLQWTYLSSHGLLHCVIYSFILIRFNFIMRKHMNSGSRLEPLKTEQLGVSQHRCSPRTQALLYKAPRPQLAKKRKQTIQSEQRFAGLFFHGLKLEFAS